MVVALTDDAATADLSVSIVGVSGGGVPDDWALFYVVGATISIPAAGIETAIPFTHNDDPPQRGTAIVWDPLADATLVTLSESGRYDISAKAFVTNTDLVQSARIMLFEVMTNNDDAGPGYWGDDTNTLIPPSGRVTIWTTLLGAYYEAGSTLRVVLQGSVDLIATECVLTVSRLS
jgi:hypothetical protein